MKKRILIKCILIIGGLVLLGVCVLFSDYARWLLYEYNRAHGPTVKTFSVLATMGTVFTGGECFDPPYLAYANPEAVPYLLKMVRQSKDPFSPRTLHHLRVMISHIGRPADVAEMKELVQHQFVKDHDFDNAALSGNLLSAIGGVCARHPHDPRSQIQSFLGDVQFWETRQKLVEMQEGYFSTDPKHWVQMYAGLLKNYLSFGGDRDFARSLINEFIGALSAHQTLTPNSGIPAIERLFDEALDDAEPCLALDLKDVPPVLVSEQSRLESHFNGDYDHPHRPGFPFKPVPMP